ncbi:hypothetical protein CJ030_MR1G023596 [Morella rubra]|uniref:Uncharacterized protein n=1 Tax=Morella rubra TaxID=262757 RepID=A0A6A1WNH0_9ROSI|nr:hypothetical protein CJ030_MR1G023596 [Morella rubra]
MVSGTLEECNPPYRKWVGFLRGTFASIGSWCRWHGTSPTRRGGRHNLTLGVNRENTENTSRTLMRVLVQVARDKSHEERRTEVNRADTGNTLRTLMRSKVTALHEPHWHLKDVLVLGPNDLGWVDALPEPIVPYPSLLASSVEGSQGTSDDGVIDLTLDTEDEE